MWAGSHLSVVVCFLFFFDKDGDRRDLKIEQVKATVVPAV